MLTVSYTKVDGATTDGNDKTVDVTLPDYTSVGVYTYTINETAGTTAGVDYDAASVTMKVTVVNGDTAGTFKVAAVSFTKGDKKIENGEVAFNNTYTANKLAVSKEVTSFGRLLIVIVSPCFSLNGVLSPILILQLH